MTLNHWSVPPDVDVLVSMSPSIARCAPYSASSLYLVPDCSARDGVISSYLRGAETTGIVIIYQLIGRNISMPKGTVNRGMTVLWSAPRNLPRLVSKASISSYPSKPKIKNLTRFRFTHNMGYQ